MATRKPPSRKESQAQAAPDQVPPDSSADSATPEPEAAPAAASNSTAGQAPATGEAAASAAGTALAAKPAEPEAHKPRFHFFIIDAGWKSVAAKVLRENFHMIREFQNSDVLYVLNAQQSIKLIRDNPDLIGKDPVLLVHDLHAKGGRGESGYHGFRLCLGLLKNSQQALTALQEFLRFIQAHRRSADIEKDIRAKLHKEGLEGAIEVIGESAKDMMER